MSDRAVPRLSSLAIRSLAAVLFIAGALMFFKAGDTIPFSTTNETGAT